MGSCSSTFYYILGVLHKFEVVNIKNIFESWDEATQAVDDGEINIGKITKVIIYYEDD